MPIVDHPRGRGPPPKGKKKWCFTGYSSNISIDSLAICK